MTKTILKTIVGWAVLCGFLHGAEFKAGIGRTIITPQSPIWMAGFANRTHASEGVIHDLWAKALALEDSDGGRVLIVATDLIGMPHEITDDVAARLMKKYSLERSQILFNSSHTHCGPVVRPMLQGMFILGEEDRQQILAYRRQLPNQLFSAAEAALADLAPARLSCGHGSASFAVNRRQMTPKGPIIGVNPQGPVDHDVPVLKIATPQGKLRAVVFGYACHNNSLVANTYQINGDYAGFAQLEFEKSQPGVTAMFLMLCGADQNANPRGTVELSSKYGKSLAEEIGRVLDGELRPVRPPVHTAYEIVNLDFAAHQRATFEEQTKSKDRLKREWATRMIETYDQGRPIRSCPYPIQAVRLGDDWTLLALGGEVVVDFSLRLKREFARENLTVAGYSNDMMCYIPSLRVLREGGYEAKDNMIFYNQPGPLAENVEETVIAGCREVLGRTGAKSSAQPETTQSSPEGRDQAFNMARTVSVSPITP